MELQKPSRITMSQQAVNILRDYVLGMDDSSTKLPSESKIAEQMGLSRLTVREALTVLESEGLIVKNQGSSTVVTTFARKLAENIDYKGELGSFIENCGYELGVKLISYDIIKVDEYSKKHLSLIEGDEILQVKKIFLADKRVAAFCINRIPMKLLSKECINEESLGKSIFDFVENNSDIVFEYDYMEIIPELVTEEISKITGVELDLPILRVDVVKYSDNGEGIMYNSEYYMDDLIRFSVLRSNNGNNFNKLVSNNFAMRGDL